MEEGDAPRCQDAADLVTDKLAGITLSPMIRVGANRAYLGVGIGLQAYPGHGHQAVTGEDAILIPERYWSGKNGARFGEGRQGQHGRDILFL